MPDLPKPDLRGIVTVLNTPFTEQDRLDYPALQRHAQSAIEAGVTGFLVPAMAAEVAALSGAERNDMVAAVLETATGKTTVIAGASAATQAERCANAQHLTKLGSDIILVSQPFRTPDQYIADLTQLAQVTDRPLMVQDWDATGSGVPIPVLLDAYERIPAFQYLKVETLDAGPKYTALKQATGGSLHVSGGWAVTQLVEALDRGVDAFMPTALHRIYVTIYRLHHAGDRQAAAALFHRALPILAFSNQHLEHSIYFFKRLLWRQGIYPTSRLRAPEQAFDRHHQRIADELIDLAIALEAELTPSDTP